MATSIAFCDLENLLKHHEAIFGKTELRKFEDGSVAVRWFGHGIERMQDKYFFRVTVALEWAEAYISGFRVAQYRDK